MHATLPWPLAARLAMEFRDLGCRVHAICPPVHPLRVVRGIEAAGSFGSWGFEQSLIKAIDRSQPDYIVPADDRAIWQLHALAASYPRYRDLVARSLGDPKSFATVRSRMSLLSLAGTLQIPTPPTVSLKSQEDADDRAGSWGYPAVVKLDGTNGGRGVAVVANAQELREAYRRLCRNTSALSNLKRRLVDNDTLAFFRPSTLCHQEVSLQSFVDGTPANAMYACFEGRLLATMQVRTVCAQHATGAALIAERIKDARIEDAGRKLAGALSLSGFFGLDFILERGTGQPYLLELNPRATQLGHLPLENASSGGSLAEVLWMAWTGNAVPRPAPATGPARVPQRIAFYPQALALGADDGELASAWLDRPRDEPSLVRALAKLGSPDKRLIYRLFHSFYVVDGDKPVVFPEARSGMGSGDSGSVRSVSQEEIVASGENLRSL
jgi:hypothetical protein